MVNLREHRDLAVGQAVDQIDLPQRSRAVKRTREDPRHLLGQLLVRRRRRQRQLAHVVLQVEVRVVDPVRIVEPERDLLEPPAKRRKQRQPLGNQVVDVGQLKASVRPRRGIEHGHPAHMTGLARRFEGQELGVERCQLSHISLSIEGRV